MARSARPIILGVVGDSAAGKTTITRGLVRILGEDQVTHVCTDDYHRYDRKQRADLRLTPLNPGCNYIDIAAQDLEHLREGEPILKPVYRHADGTFGPPTYVKPHGFAVVEGLLGYHTAAMRDCYDVRVYLAPPEELRRKWKVQRDCSRRGYTTDEVLAELDRREPDSAQFIRPQERYADVVVSFREGDNGDPHSLDAELVLRDGLPHPDLSLVVGGGDRGITIDERGSELLLSVAGDIEREQAVEIEEAIWGKLHFASHLRSERLGEFTIGNDLQRSESLALVQLIILYHLVTAKAAIATGSAGRRAIGSEHPASATAAGAADPRRVERGVAVGLETTPWSEAAAVATGVDRLCIDTIRTLTMDAVERAKSGHPGMPMAMAPIAYLLYTRFMRHNPRDPHWPDRDRFVLSAGHGSMLLYSALHLSGYDLPLDELRRFRQWGSKTPGHPERDRVNETPGVETTTGPLGQGLGVAVGMALAERFLRERFGEEVMDHRVFGICSDGDLQEGLSHEAASLAGHLGLGRIVFLYDDNAIQLDGPTSESFSEDVSSRFRAYGWHTLRVDDPNDLEALSTAIGTGVAESSRPTLIAVKSIIGWPAPNRQNTSKAHGAPLGEDEVRATKELLGWDPNAEFVVPAEAYERFSQVERGAALQAEWQDRFDAWRAERCDLAGEWDAAWSDPARPMPGLADALPGFDLSEDGALATRAAGARVMEAFAPFTPTMVGGAADLSESTKTEFPGEAVYTREVAGRNVKFGVREHAMGAAVNGMALHGGIVKPYGSTFLIFSDYMRPAIRLSALMGLPVVWVFSHDSIGLGEDGPTHQPVEHYAALRAIPGLTVIRPADAAETAEAWRVALEELDTPVCLLLTRQPVPILDRGRHAPAAGLARGAYVLAEPEGGPADAVVAASGSEVAVAVDAQGVLAAEGVRVRVVSMPSWELFEAQPGDYQASVLPPELPTIAVEAGVALGWSRWARRTVTLGRFGASAPGPEVMEKLGFTPELVAAAVRTALAAG